jgi:hypothetical protein
MRGWLSRSPKLTYANVTATLALVLALGGGAYAAATIDSGDVVDDSLRSRDIKDATLAGRDIHDGAVGGSDVRDGSLGTKDVANGSLVGRDVADEALTSGDVASLADSRGVLKLNAGDSETLLQKGPFSLVASCQAEAAPPDSLRVEVAVESTESGAVLDLGPSGAGLINADSLAINEEGADFEWQGRAYLLAAPGGDTLAGYVAGGVHALGADCAAVASGEGGRGIRHALKP